MVGTRVPIEKQLETRKRNIKRWQEINKERIKARKAVHLAKPEVKEKYRVTRKAYVQRNSEHIRLCNNKPRNKMHRMVTAASRRAILKGLIFEQALYRVLEANPPSNCRCCGIELDYNAKGSSNDLRSPSLDRVDNSKGYEVSNVAVVCWRCNHLKNDSTLDELETIVRYVKKWYALN